MTRSPAKTAALRTTVVAGALALLLAGAAGEEQPAPTAAADAAEVAAPPYTPTSGYEERKVLGWTVYVNRELLDDHGELAGRALDLLESQLLGVTLRVPEPAIDHLRDVPIWLEYRCKDARGACYHPSRRWLETNGYNPDKAASIEISHADNFIRWWKDQPWMVMHELAHAYHHRVLGHGHEGIREAYRRAQETGDYDAVPDIHGAAARKAYAMNNEKEFFAEATEAFFGTNDIYPYVRSELKAHDPGTYALLEEVWLGRAPSQPAS